MLFLLVFLKFSLQISLFDIMRSAIVFLNSITENFITDSNFGSKINCQSSLIS